RRLRDSNTVTRNPRGASATAAARPARPPPMMATRSATSDPPPAHGEGPQQEGELPPSAQSHPPAEYVVVAGLNLLQQTAVRSIHHLEYRAARRREHGRQRFRGFVIAAGPVHLKAHERPEPLRAAITPLSGRALEALHFIARQVDPAAGQIFGEVAQDV